MNEKPGEKLDLQHLNEQVDAFDDAVSRTPGIDTYCSSSAWILAAHEAFHEAKNPLIYRLGSGYVAMQVDWAPGWGNLLLPMEASWCLACPLVGPDPAEATTRLFSVLRGLETQWDSMMIAGIPDKGILWEFLVHVFSSRYGVFRGSAVARRLADLRDGLDGFMAARTSKFRNNLRRAEKAGQKAGFRYRYYDQSMSPAAIETLFNSIMDIEERCWKGVTRQGVNEGSMRIFYQRLMELQAPRGRIRAIITECDGKDVGYILGGVFDNIYRGYQFSFDEKYTRLSPGNLMQLRMIEALCREGIAWYDLGTDRDYKRYWGETIFETVSLIIRR